jgi:hypothetical protein
LVGYRLISHNVPLTGIWAARDEGQDHAGDLHDVQQQEEEAPEDAGGGDQEHVQQLLSYLEPVC